MCVILFNVKMLSTDMQCVNILCGYHNTQHKNNKHNNTKHNNKKCSAECHNLVSSLYLVPLCSVISLRILYLQTLLLLYKLWGEACVILSGHYDTQHNDAQHNDTV